MASDDGAILIVFMMMCVFSVVLSAGMTYTCTGGTFDFDDFDADKCFEIPQDEGSGTGAGGAGPSGSNDPNDYEYYSSPDGVDLGLACGGFLYEDAMTTCYDIGSGEAGVRWEWLDADAAEECKNLVTKYSVVVSSSKSNHIFRYRFPDVMGRNSNAFKFRGAPDDFLAGQNVKFEITPLNDLNEKIGSTVLATLDTNNSSEICNAHGDAVDFSEATLIQDSDPQPQVPVDCEGGTWSDWGPCMMNLVDITNDPICKSGIQTRELSGYTEPSGGGTCNIEQSQSCRSEGCTVVTEPAQDCVVGEWDSQLASSSLSYPLYSDTFTGANTCSAACSGPPGSYPGAKSGGGIRVESRDIKFEQKGTGAACPDLRREQACNTQLCPKDCVGAWQDSNYTYSVSCGKNSINSVSASYKEQNYVVTENEIAPGTCSNRNASRHVRTEIRESKGIGYQKTIETRDSMPNADNESYCPSTSSGRVSGS